MARKIGIWALVLGLVFAVAVGCAGYRIKKAVPAYEAKVKQLEDMGGAQKAPYETTKAREYLKFFEHEVAEGDSKGAAFFEQKIDQYVDQGMTKVK